MKITKILIFILLITKIKNRSSLSINQNINKLYKERFFLQEVTYSQLNEKIEKHEITNIYFPKTLDSVLLENEKKTGNDYNDYSIVNVSPLITNDIANNAVKHHIEPIFLKDPYPGPIETFSKDAFGFVSSYFVPFVFITLIINSIRNFILFSSNQNNPLTGGMPRLNLDFKKDKENMINSNITLNSFAGSPEIFEECTEVVSYLKNETLYKNAGAEIPRGILLEGPPGTGKTLLAKAIASEANANFLSISASEFIEVFVGMGASKIRNLFNSARQNKPCIIFIDEIDSVGRQRGAGINMGNDEREQTLNQLLAEMDGFANNDGILVIAATNRKDVLDAALLRPGRFDRIITVALPDKSSRKEIIKVHSKNKNLEENINLDLIAELTSGFSGAQIKNLLNEAAIFAARKGTTIISENDILNSLDKLIVGLVRKIDTRSDEAKRRIAIHETGHALLCSLFDDLFELKKVTIQSTYNGAGGYTLFNEHNNITDSGLYTKNLLKKRLVIAMGGKAAENIYYGNEYISVGAVQDLKQANSLAQRMICNYGMGKDLEAFYNENVESERNPFLGRSLGLADKYSEKTKEVIDKESIELVNDALDTAKYILSNHREKMDIIIKELLKNNTLYGKELNNLVF